MRYNMKCIFHCNKHVIPQSLYSAVFCQVTRHTPTHRECVADAGRAGGSMADRAGYA
jgi:ligand-binding sensor protein